MTSRSIVSLPLTLTLLAGGVLASGQLGCAAGDPATQGVAGTNGGAGTTGVAGTTGAAGTTGVAGTTGAAGTTGQAGTTGAAGSTTGVAGTTGAAGNTGVAGTTGAAGTTGVAGATGVAGTGGRGGSGGAAATGGRGGGAGASGPGTGGSSITGAGGITAPVENPSAGCTVGPMPAFSSLTANAKLPDPFKKMDGTAMTTKKEWLCRREEILRLGYEFIYGEKPKPAASGVTGTLSGTNVSVMVSDAGKSASFSATIQMPTSGTAPYPAVITYTSVAANLVTEMRNRGVAVINYNPISVASEAASGAGAFTTIYGSNHPAGRLAAWAWGVSRIIDVIEKNPGMLNPAKIAVTGCSRYGKGALVAGLFDGRVALTIPIESGIGGTPALRLIERLDSYSGAEWPYHAISYVAWFSPMKLGQFTTANNAAGDNTDKLPVDMHEMMALIAPRGLLIVDNPSTNYNGLDRNSAYATGAITQKVFEALGVKNSLTYVAASGDHCAWRSQYTAPLIANIQKFLLNDAAATTGTFTTDLGGTRPTPESHMDFTIPTLSGDL